MCGSARWTACRRVALDVTSGGHFRSGRRTAASSATSREAIERKILIPPAAAPQTLADTPAASGARRHLEPRRCDPSSRVSRTARSPELGIGRPGHASHDVCPPTRRRPHAGLATVSSGRASFSVLPAQCEEGAPGRLCRALDSAQATRVLKTSAPSRVCLRALVVRARRNTLRTGVRRPDAADERRSGSSGGWCRLLGDRVWIHGGHRVERRL